jgi:hypothetical protein
MFQINFSNIFQNFFKNIFTNSLKYIISFNKDAFKYWSSRKRIKSQFYIGMQHDSE